MPAMRGAMALLHGVASNHTRWSEFIRDSALRESWQLLAPDLRGHGAKAFRGRIGIDEWCDDLVALLDRERLPRAVVAGHCLGANLALHFAARHPDRTAGLVLIEPMPPEALAGTMRRVSRLRPLLSAILGVVRFFNAIGLRRRNLQPLDLEKLDKETRAALARGPQGEAQLARYASPFFDLRTTATAAYLQDLLAVTEALPPAEAIPVPVLALLAAQSNFTDVEQVTTYLARIASCEILTLPAKHWIPTEQPDAMRAAIEAWIAKRFPEGI